MWLQQVEIWRHDAGPAAAVVGESAQAAVGGPSADLPALRDQAGRTGGDDPQAGDLWLARQDLPSVGSHGDLGIAGKPGRRQLQLAAAGRGYPPPCLPTSDSRVPDLRDSGEDHRYGGREQPRDPVDDEGGRGNPED